MVLNDMAVGSNSAVPGSLLSPEGSESAMSCLMVVGLQMLELEPVAVITPSLLTLLGTWGTVPSW